MTSFGSTVATAQGPQLNGAGPALLATMLPDLEDALTRAGAPVADLSPGIERSAVEQELAKLGLECPEELIVWLGWHNGATDQFNHILPGYEFWNLDLIVTRHLDMRGWPHGTEDWQWDPHWLQFLGDNNGLAMWCDEPRRSQPVIRRIDATESMSREPTPFQAVSLCTIVSWWISAIEVGYLQWRETGWLFGSRDLLPEQVRRTSLI
jgi:hypothetical protein